MKKINNLFKIISVIILNVVSELIFILLSDSDAKLSSALIFFSIGIFTYFIFSIFLNSVYKTFKMKLSLIVLFLSIFGIILNIHILYDISNIHFLLLFANIMLASIFQLLTKESSVESKEKQTNKEVSSKYNFLKKNKNLFMIMAVGISNAISEILFFLFSDVQDKLIAAIIFFLFGFFVYFSFGRFCDSIRRKTNMRWALVGLVIGIIGVIKYAYSSFNQVINIQFAVICFNLTMASLNDLLKEKTAY